MNKLDEIPFAFSATDEKANVVDVDGVMPIGDSVTVESNGDQCDDTSILHVPYNIGRRCWDQIAYLVLIVIGIIFCLYC